MPAETTLDTRKEYTWFISNIDTRTIKGVQTLVFDWTCKEVNVKVREYLRICNTFKGSRLYNMMKALGWDENKDPDAKPQEFFVKGFHMKAYPIRYYSEMNSEVMSWKLDFESLKPMEDKAPTVSDEDMKTLIRLTTAKGSYQDTLAHLATHRVELVEPFIRLCKEGKFTFAKK